MYIKRFVLIFVVAVLVILAMPACKTQDTIVEPDDIQFVCVSGKVQTQYEDFADVSVGGLIKVRTSAATSVTGTIYIGSKSRTIGMEIPSTGGQWVDMPIPTREFMMNYGLYEIWGELTLASTGKTVATPPVPFNVVK